MPRDVSTISLGLWKLLCLYRRASDVDKEILNGDKLKISGIYAKYIFQCSLQNDRRSLLKLVHEESDFSV